MSNQQNAATPWEFIESVKKRFSIDEFGFDIACTIEDCKGTEGYYFDEGIDGLDQDWTTITARYSFLNPPWKKITPFARKCAQLRKRAEKVKRESEVFGTELPYTNIFSLFPCGAGSKWFADYVEGNATVYFTRPRITFIDPRTGKPFVSIKTGKPQTGLQDTMLIDWKGPPKITTWKWK